MAKEKKEDKVSTEKEVGKEDESLETAFSEGGAEEGAEEKEIISEELGETETVAEPETKPAGDETAEAEEQVAEEKLSTEGTPAEKTWSELGLPRFDGMSKAQIAADIDYNIRIDGRQKQELGDLRRFKAGVEEKEVEARRKAATEKIADPLAGLQPMSEGEIIEFNKLYDENPVKAILAYASPHFKKIIAEELKTALPDAVGSQMTAQAESVRYREFLGKNEDAKDYLDAMQELDKPENLGQQRRSYEDLLEIAKLGVNEDKLYGPIYQTTRSYPNMSFADAKKYVELQLRSPEQTAQTKDKLKKEIAAVNVTGSGKKTQAQINKANSVDDAFDIEDEPIT